MLFHEEERATTALLEAYETEKPNSVLTLTFENGAIYRCRFNTAFEDELEDASIPGGYDEFYTLVYEIVETVSHVEGFEAVYENMLCINYRCFPICVLNESGDAIYQRR